MTPFQFKTDPYLHQRKTWEATRDKPFWALFLDMGTGKSKVTLDTAGWLYAQEKIDSLLVLAPKGVYDNWVEAEIPTHLSAPARVALWDAQGKAANKKACADILKPGGFRILVVNVEGLQLAQGKGRSKKITRSRSLEYVHKFLDTGCTLGVADESTKIANPKAKRTQAALEIARRCPYRRILSGTPLANGPLKLFGQAEFLEPGLTGFSSLWDYQRFYCEMVRQTIPVFNQKTGRTQDRSFNQITGYRRMDKLREKMLAWSTIIKKEDCLDLPPKTYKTRYVEPTKEQKEHYRALKFALVSQLEGIGIVTAENAMKKAQQLQALLCGFILNEDGDLHRLPTNRTQALLDEIEECEKAIIFTTRRECVHICREAIAKEYGEDAVASYYGDTKLDARASARRQFQDMGSRLRFLVAVSDTAQMGLTLTAANHVVYYDNDFDAEKREQSSNRAHRIGQSRAVSITDLVVRGSIDEVKLEALNSKLSLANELTPSNWRKLFSGNL